MDKSQLLTFLKFNSFFTLVLTKYIFIPKVMVSMVHVINVLRRPAEIHDVPLKKGEYNVRGI